ncbi:Bcr/CflA family drug resistance efflux transporter [Vibrio nigripulchritudo]|uniref:multidrug effflux MFS transporter n=1 Tax=Vibrio nigripulchritudo TaxID=28173 RepID=UPI00190E17EB|nr:multidrug effflux MFS transporter [Vibrio nigripulchritudo]BCL73508.1 Bcr/CflA family drug resistance efflux transporter [Vibrio nigripulchritudo]BDU34875.1 Bcr/CflA family drug resistance efflux transporter [Vibrio nigripulchritudo]
MKRENFSKLPLMLAMMVIATGQVGVSIYLPGLPEMSRQFSDATLDIQWLVTIYMVGLGAAQLIYGPVADSLGRKPVFIFGQGLYLVGTSICVFLQHDLNWIIFGRLLQGLGAGSTAVIANSILRDSYDGNTLAKALSYVSIMASVMPMVAPVLGGWLTWQFGWESVFVFVFAYVALIYVTGLLILPETLPYPAKAPQLFESFRAYADLIKTPQVIATTTYGWVNFLMIMLSLSVMPYLVQEQLEMSAAHYGLVMILPSFGLMIGSVLQNFLNRRLLPKSILGVGLGIAFLSGVWMLIGAVSVFNLIGALTGIAIAQGLMFPVIGRMLLEPHKERAGTVTALSGSLQMLVTGVFGGLIASFITTKALLGAFLLVGTLSLIALYSCQRKGKQLDLEAPVDKALPNM